MITTKVIAIIVVVFGVSATALYLFNSKNINGKMRPFGSESENTTSTEINTVTQTETNSEANKEVDLNKVITLPHEEDIIQTFFANIDKDDPAKAILMMSPSAVGDDSSKQMWAVNFNSIESIKPVSIEPSMKDEWTDTNHSYKVTLEVKMKPESASAPIPYYGWANGTNIKWIPLEKVGSTWQIAGIASGP